MGCMHEQMNGMDGTGYKKCLFFCLRYLQHYPHNTQIYNKSFAGQILVALKIWSSWRSEWKNSLSSRQGNFFSYQKSNLKFQIYLRGLFGNPDPPARLLAQWVAHYCLSIGLSFYPVGVIINTVKVKRHFLVLHGCFPTDATLMHLKPFAFTSLA